MVERSSNSIGWLGGRAVLYIEDRPSPLWSGEWSGRPTIPTIPTIAESVGLLPLRSSPCFPAVARPCCLPADVDPQEHWLARITVAVAVLIVDPSSNSRWRFHSLAGEPSSDHFNTMRDLAGQISRFFKRTKLWTF